MEVEVTKCKVCKNTYKRTTSMYGEIWEDCLTCGKTREEIENPKPKKEVQEIETGIDLSLDEFSSEPLRYNWSDISEFDFGTDFDDGSSDLAKKYNN